jgi:hypothetical protein
MTDETFGAKQVATRIGTDAKTFRKFLRSSASPYEAVGQGSRYEFPQQDLAAIKKSFIAWQKGKRPKRPPTPKPVVTPDPDSARRNRERELAEAILDFPDNDPTDEDLDEIEDEELDIDE